MVLTVNRRSRYGILAIYSNKWLLKHAFGMGLENQNFTISQTKHQPDKVKDIIPLINTATLFISVVKYFVGNWALLW